MFKTSSLPKEARELFNKEAILWPAAVSTAIEGGFSKIDDLANLVFFMHHKERMVKGVGKALDPSEPNFEALASEWKGFREMVASMIKGKGAPPPKSKVPPSWTLSDRERNGLLDAGGQELLDWAQIAPDETESREFEPSARHQEQYKTIFAWKSLNPKKTCLAAPQHKLQFVMMLRDDIGFWRKHAPSERQADIKRTAQHTAIRAYRRHVIEKKICPRGAEQAEIALGKTLILEMAKGLLAVIPVPGLKGSPQVKSLGDIISALASLAGG